MQRRSKCRGRRRSHGQDLQISDLHHQSVVYTLNVEMWYLFSLIVVITCTRGVYGRADNGKGREWYNSVIITKKARKFEKEQSLEKNNVWGFMVGIILECSLKLIAQVLLFVVPLLDQSIGQVDTSLSTKMCT